MQNITMILVHLNLRVFLGKFLFAIVSGVHIESCIRHFIMFTRATIETHTSG
jgi:hypothetical protein